MAFSTVLLDLDGTITNPYMGITNGVMYAYEHLGLEVPPRESLRSFCLLYTSDAADEL
mgnify:CR=1 FL=1